MFSHRSFPEVGEKQKAYKEKKKKEGENYGPLRFRPTPRVVHASRQDQYFLLLNMILMCAV